MPDPTITARAAAFDLAIVLGAITVAWLISRWVVYPALGIPDNAPLILRPITGFLVAWWLLHRRGLGWRSLGLRMPPSWARLVLVTIALCATDYAVSQWVVPAIAQLVHPTQAPSFMGYVRGNAGAFALWAAIGWIVGGLFEECLFRGFLFDRVAALLSNSALAIAVAIVAQAVLFGALHLYGGTFAFLYAAMFALVHGVFYLIAGRNLVPLIFVHGLWNSVQIYGVYAS